MENGGWISAGGKGLGGFRPGGFRLPPKYSISKTIMSKINLNNVAFETALKQVIMA